MLAKGPAETAPWVIVARIIFKMAAVLFWPENANPMTKIPWPNEPVDQKGGIEAQAYSGWYEWII